MNNHDLAKLLGIKLCHTTASGRGEYWTLETPVSVRPHPFSKNGPPVYELKTKGEVEAFLAGYSLVVRQILTAEHTPK